MLDFKCYININTSSQYFTHYGKRGVTQYIPNVLYTECTTAQQHHRQIYSVLSHYDISNCHLGLTFRDRDVKVDVNLVSLYAGLGGLLSNYNPFMTDNGYMLTIVVSNITLQSRLITLSYFGIILSQNINRICNWTHN